MIIADFRFVVRAREIAMRDGAPSGWHGQAIVVAFSDDRLPVLPTGSRVVCTGKQEAACPCHPLGRLPIADADLVGNRKSGARTDSHEFIPRP